MYYKLNESVFSKDLVSDNSGIIFIRSTELIEGREYAVGSNICLEIYQYGYEPFEPLYFTYVGIFMKKELYENENGTNYVFTFLLSEKECNYPIINNTVWFAEIAPAAN